jgi:type IV fimbrial biogenesis protein FimT
MTQAAYRFEQRRILIDPQPTATMLESSRHAVFVPEQTVLQSLPTILVTAACLANCHIGRVTRKVTAFCLKVQHMQNKSHKSFRLQKFHTSGFTLIEVMVSLAVLGILAALAAPSFSESIKKYRVNAIREELIASLQTARTEAIRRSRPVVLIREIDTSVCSETMATNDDWNCGWRVVVDADSSDSISTTERDAPLKVTLLPKGYDVQHTSLGNQIVFGPWGQATGVGQKFVIYNSTDGISGNSTKSICISSGGRIRVVKGSTCS